MTIVKYKQTWRLSEEDRESFWKILAFYPEILVRLGLLGKLRYPVRVSTARETLLNNIKYTNNYIDSFFKLFFIIYKIHYTYIDWVKQHLDNLDDDETIITGSLFLEMQPELTLLVDYRQPLQGVQNLWISHNWSQRSDKCRFCVV